MERLHSSAAAVSWSRRVLGSPLEIVFLAAGLLGFWFGLFLIRTIRRRSLQSHSLGLRTKSHRLFDWIGSDRPERKYGLEVLGVLGATFRQAADFILRERQHRQEQ